MVFFASHQYLATNFHLNNFFCWELYFCPIIATWNDVSIYFVPNISQVILVFIFCKCLCYAWKKPQHFTFTVRNSLTYSHLTRIQEFFEEFNNDFYLWKGEVTTKYSILASELHIFHFLFSYRALYLLVQYNT